MRKNRFFQLPIVLMAVYYLSGCAAKGDYPGVEFSPNMYHSVAYEPLTQITDKNSGNIVSSIDDGQGEFYNSNPYNPGGINMREPAANTVRRSSAGVLPYRIPKDSIDVASRILKNPIELTDESMARGKVLYNRFCVHCHGGNGQGSQDADAKVGDAFKGVPAYNVGRVKDLSEGHIFHTIMQGRGRMGAHGSQIAINDIWRIVHYVQTLQKLETED
jgi:mono/diheme cytochrome c family protein